MDKLADSGGFRERTTMEGRSSVSIMGFANEYSSGEENGWLFITAAILASVIVLYR